MDSNACRSRGIPRLDVGESPARDDADRDDVRRIALVAVRVADLDDKEALLASGAEALFTEPHDNGFPAVLVRLPLVEPGLLEELLADAWRCVAPRALVDEHGRDRSP